MPGNNKITNHPAGSGIFNGTIFRAGDQLVNGGQPADDGELAPNSGPLAGQGEAASVTSAASLSLANAQAAMKIENRKAVITALQARLRTLGAA